MTLKEIINDWDPVNLFPGAPNDEYNPEIVEIEGLLKHQRGINDISVLIYSVFNKYFGDVFEKTKNDCDYIAKKIFQEMSLKFEEERQVQ